MKKILIGDADQEFCNALGETNWENSNKVIKGGLYQSEMEGIYVAFDCSGDETFVENFNDVVEAAKYANGIKARTIDNVII